MKTEKADFALKHLYADYHLITYTSPVTGRKWSAPINGLSIIDDLKNDKKILHKELNYWKRYCKERSKSSINKNRKYTATFVDAKKLYKKKTGRDYGIEPGCNGIKIFYLTIKRTPTHRFFVGTDIEWTNL